MAQEAEAGMSGRELWHAVSHSGLFFVVHELLTFSIMTVLAIFYEGLVLCYRCARSMVFTTYALTIIWVRLVGSSKLDTLPRHEITA